MNQETEIQPDNTQAQIDAGSKQEAEYYKGAFERREVEAELALKEHKEHFERLDQPELDNIDPIQNTPSSQNVEANSERQQIDSMLNKAEEKLAEAEQAQEKEEDDLGY